MHLFEGLGVGDSRLGFAWLTNLSRCIKQSKAWHHLIAGESCNCSPANKNMSSLPQSGCISHELLACSQACESIFGSAKWGLTAPPLGVRNHWSAVTRCRRSQDRRYPKLKRNISLVLASCSDFDFLNSIYDIQYICCRMCLLSLQNHAAYTVKWTSRDSSR